MMIKLYGVPGTRSARVSWTLTELGLDYEFQPILLRAGEGQSAAFQKLNPLGKVPVLVDEGQVLTESTAIMSYLADRYGRGALIPEPGSLLRAQHDALAVFAVAELEQPLWLAARHSFLYPEAYRVAEILPSTHSEWKRASRALEHHLERSDGPYVLGSMFCVADIALAHVLRWAGNAKYALSDALQGYAERCYARPAAQAFQAREEQAMQLRRQQAETD
nr:glutathione S-transferase family protein [Oceanococcus sp. HetDA_MAG_MS8]